MLAAVTAVFDDKYNSIRDEHIPIRISFVDLSALVDRKMEEQGVMFRRRATPKILGRLLRRQGFKRGKGLLFIGGRSYVECTYAEMRRLYDDGQ